MKKLFVLLVIGGLVVALGFYLGWFRTEKDRIKEDGHTAIEKAEEVGGRVTESVQKGVDKFGE